MTVDHAQSYVRYITETLHSRELFEWIVVEPQIFWGQLLFMNGCNYGGVKIVSSPEEQVDVDFGPGESQISQQEEQIISHWNIAEYLTEHGQEAFEIAIGEIIDRPYQFKKVQVAKLMDSCITVDEGEEVDVGEAEDDQNDGKNNKTSMTSKEIVEAVNEKAKSVVRDYLTPTLLRFVPSIEEQDGKDSFPQLAGSYYKMDNPASEFVKSVCHVLGLDSNISAEVTVLKRELNRLIGVREFSKESNWRSPCLSFVLPDVICDFCNDCVDLDLCRDPILADASEADVQTRWRCQACDHSYNLQHIEQRLVEYLQNRSVGYQLQDLSCQKCKSIKDDNLCRYCQCSGNFRCAGENPATMSALLRVFGNIASFHKFEWLQETVEWMSDLRV